MLVRSRNLAGFDYDAAREELTVDFHHHDARYLYRAVPPSVPAAMAALEARGGSVGEYFDSNVRHTYAFVQLR